MLDIGAQLRETRMRRRIDISEVEAATKIRAKYLRALENEEWSLLPGPTFVKTFLRTYAEYLDLDARSLVEEYRQRYERPATTELTPFGPGMGGRPPPRRRRASPLGEAPPALGGAGAARAPPVRPGEGGAPPAAPAPAGARPVGARGGRVRRPARRALRPRDLGRRQRAAAEHHRPAAGH